MITTRERNALIEMLDCFAHDNDLTVNAVHWTNEMTELYFINKKGRKARVLIGWDAVDSIYKTFNSITDHVTNYGKNGDVRLTFNHNPDDERLEYCTSDVEATQRLYKMAKESMFMYNQKLPKIQNVIFNDPATIVFWADGTKTVVKAENEEFDPEKGLAMAISKKALGNKHDYYHTFLHWLKRYCNFDICQDKAIKKLDDELEMIRNRADSGITTESAVETARRLSRAIHDVTGNVFEQSLGEALED